MPLGFVPLKLFFDDHKTGYEVLSDPKFNYACKIYSVIHYLQELNGFSLIVIIIIKKKS